VPREHEPTVRKAVEDWAQLWETIVEISHRIEKPWAVRCADGRKVIKKFLPGGNSLDGREKILSRLFLKSKARSINFWKKMSA